MPAFSYGMFSRFIRMMLAIPSPTDNITPVNGAPGKSYCSNLSSCYGQNG